jgi:hypothetical protein
VLLFTVVSSDAGNSNSVGAGAVVVVVGAVVVVVATVVVVGGEGVVVLDGAGVGSGDCPPPMRNPTTEPMRRTAARPRTIRAVLVRPSGSGLSVVIHPPLTTVRAAFSPPDGGESKVLPPRSG